MKRAVAYGRYSTDMQREESIDAQFRAIRDYCQRNEIELVSTYADEGISGTTDNRPQFQQMIKDAELGAFDYVIVHKLDRFSRSKYDSAIYKRKLKLLNVQLLSVLENLDGSPESLILESVLEGMSEYYSRNLSREVKKGMRENALKCKFNGGTPPLGYDVDENKNYVINAHEAEAIKLIFDMFTKNYSYSQMMMRLNNLGYKTKRGREFTRNSFYEILNNERYIGIYFYSKEDYDGFRGKRNYHKKRDKSKMIRIENGVPAIIDKDTWAKAQEKIKNNKNLNRINKNGRFYLLTGLIFCGECGSPMSGNMQSNNQGNRYYYYKCNRKSRTHKCHAPVVRAEKIEKEVLDCFEDVIFTQTNKDAVIKSMLKFLDKETDTTDHKKSLEKELAAVEKQIENILDAIISGISSPIVNDKLKELETKKETLKASISRCNIISYKSSNLIDEIKEFLNKNNSIYDFTPQEQSVILKNFIDKIIYKDKKITVQLKMLDRAYIYGAGNPVPDIYAQKVIVLEVA
uniref:Integrase n=1 Tax=Firmicutes phage HS17 TaxID=3056395 RepID=A0AA49X4L6_9VIRU|nr:MAG: integrase [Firmicutes phage HS17]